MNDEFLYEYLEEKYHQYHNALFVEEDPIQIPHEFSGKEDREISGFLTATISWGKRNLIIRSAKNLMERMDNAPYDFVVNATESDLKTLDGFVHRTFQPEDLKFFVNALHDIYTQSGGLEGAFSKGTCTRDRIENFRNLFLATPHAERSKKHVSSPLKGSSAKRINMFLRWMVREDSGGVDFGLWKKIPTADLMIPLDVHTGTVARKLGLLQRKANDWKALEELMLQLHSYDPMDPAKYDFALFGIGVSGELKD
jgi:uncharacterized protein (TIGR02757 family)